MINNELQQPEWICTVLALSQLSIPTQEINQSSRGGFGKLLQSCQFVTAVCRDLEWLVSSGFMAYPYSFPSKSGQETSPDALCHVGEVKLTNSLCTFFLDFCP